MTGREIRDVLDAAGVLPSKQLGQNFLIDPNLARWIVAQLEVTAADAVVEVGPGTGSLSEQLVGKVRRLILIEWDARLAGVLRERFRGEASVEVQHADGAKFDGRTLFKHRPLKFLGNLPYASGGAILKNLLSRPHPFERAVIMLQAEVIARLAATPGTKDYGVLSLRTQANWRVEPLRSVPPEAFYPRPTIDSRVAVLRPQTAELPTFDARLFDELIRRGFAQRRKQLKKQMPPQPAWDTLTSRLGLATTVRGEELTLAQWIELTRHYDPHPLKDLPQNAAEILDVVDAHDQVIGTATRAQVHAKSLLHRAVHVHVYNPHGDLLLQQRSRLKDVHPGRWDSSVAGHLEAGETYLTAATRELDEEMGIREVVPEEVARLNACAATGWEHVRVYRACYEGPLHFPCAEIEAAVWFPPAEIAAWMSARPADFAAGFLACWQAHAG
ncbi:MAG: 16S rRNA (adenine(1518)-N(6)/adenine(1519)-N(6))-dimethyltransferase RsmA [Verrucomicrobia bacterium]|nr:16S rRNA (adenine(1518)-N(6)/adenine(1519)-N(6))-dimethyltransferase RsmA [Verrucomicrobiota bacterium]